MTKRKKADPDHVMNLRLTHEMYTTLKELAAVESEMLRRNVPMQDLIRCALTYFLLNNERLREVFRRTRVNTRR